MCSFPNHVQLTEHVTGGDLKNDQWEQDAPELSCTCHGKDCQVTFVFLFLINLQEFQANIFILFSFTFHHYGVLCVEL